MSFETLAKDGQRYHAVWKVVPRLWTDNGKNPVGDGYPWYPLRRFRDTLSSIIKAQPHRKAEAEFKQMLQV